MITPTTLPEWEYYLRPRFAAVQLIGELNLTEEQTNELGKLICGILRRMSLPEANRRLEQKYPCTLATYLVFVGVYAYHDYTFWPSVHEATGLPEYPAAQKEWGQIFESVLDKFALKRHFGDQTYRFVSPILGHGGIPVDCLPAFFEYMLQPSAEQPYQLNISTSTLVHRWQTDISRSKIPKPILRFLKYGGRYAIDYVERCRDMARETLATGIVPLAATLALPSAVVYAYQEWIEQQTATQESTTTAIQQRGQSVHLRYRRPQLCLDPWEQGVYWRLPVQYLAPGTLPSAAWELSSDHAVQLLSTRLQNSSDRWHTEEQFARVVEPLDTSYARFRIGTSVLREWQLDEFPIRTHYPFFTFSPDTGELLPRQEVLPARIVWLLLSPDFQVVQEHLLTEQLPQLPAGWSAWRLVEVDLSTTSALVLKSSTQELTFPVVSTIEPVLVGTPLYLGPQTMSIYSHTPPALQFPLGTPCLLSGWRLELYQEQEGSAVRIYHGSIIDLNEEFVDEVGALILPLNLPELLGEAPFGQFRVRVRNPFDHITEFRFAVVSHLTIVGNEQLYLPSPETGASAITLLAEVDAETQLIAGDAQPDLLLTDLDLSEQSHFYELTLSPGMVQAQLMLHRTATDASSINVPLTLTVRRLRWSLQLMPTALVWNDAQIIFGLQELEESLEPSLLIDLPVWQQSPPGMVLYFLDEQGKSLLALTNSRILHKSSIWRFDLRNVATTLRHSPATSVRVKLVITGIEDEGKPLEQFVLHIQRTLHLRSLTVDATWSDNIVDVTTNWSPNPVVRNRTLQFWSLTRPWQPAITLRLPDSATGQATHALAATNLPPGRYQATVHIDDPWLPQPPTTYPPPEAHSLTLGSLSTRLAMLSASPPSREVAFEQILERALIQQFLGNSTAVEQDITWCIEHLHCATWQHRRILLETFRGHRQVKLLHFRLLDSALLKAALQDQQTQILHDEDWQWLRSEFLSLIPQAQLSPECGTLLLQFHDHQLNTATVQRMFEISLPIGVSSLVKLLESEEFCLSKAISLLQMNLHFSLHQLAFSPATPILDRLLGHLEQTHPATIANHFIRTGYWVHCQAGWGRIEQIQTGDRTFSTYLSLPQLYNGARLHIKLRVDTTDEEWIVLDMDNELVTFSGNSTIYLCAKCQQWATARQESLYYEHNSRIHGGTHSSIALSTAGTLIQTFEPEFSVTKPDNIWQ